jgi:hypothetical protein
MDRIEFLNRQFDSALEQVFRPFSDCHRLPQAAAK